MGAFSNSIGGAWGSLRFRNIISALAVTLLACYILPDLVSSQGNPLGIRCSQNGAFRAYTEKERENCKNCDFYTCIFYRNLNRWLVRTYNCTGPVGGNTTYVWTFDERERKCVVNVTATAMKG